MSSKKSDHSSSFNDKNIIGPLPLKKVKKSNKSSDILNEYKTRPKKYSCQFCKKSFKKAQALGGHISKAHP